jgi:hypothetical protein
MPNEKMQRIAAAAEELQAALNDAGRCLNVEVRKTDVWSSADPRRSHFAINVEVIDSIYP